jgi:ankyrin repeat protein
VEWWWWTKAAALSDLNAVKTLLADDVNAHFQTEKGWTPLRAACENGRVKIVKVLLTRKLIHINQAKKDGATSLVHGVSSSGSFESSPIIVTHFKEILILTKIAEERPLACAMKKGHTHIAALLRHHKVMYDKW